jgi:Xaa-Pro aminopeptidase
LDFKHGVGHGVSFCGPVHEYPHYAYGKGTTAIKL